MPERNDHPPAVEETDFLDDDLDLDELSEPEIAEAGPGEPELIDDDAADALLADELEPLEAGNGAAPLELLEPAAQELADSEPIDDVDLGDEFEPRFDDDPIAVAPEVEDRIDRLEEAARALAAAEVKRDRGRVRRKVSAASTGAAAVGVVPVVLQLAGAFELDPEIVATASTVAAAIGAFVAGWLTPERKSTLPASVALEAFTRRR